eukprot:GHVL01030928.1.p1 GENE.GHVL01030928.1~~GHVL01030928.1.p1  ORF type:complete len:416 (-),score=123.53 GHVL01030928.1:184-1431(-)
MDFDNSDVHELRRMLVQERLRRSDLEKSMDDWKCRTRTLCVQLEEEEEFLTNKLMRRIEELHKEKASILQQVEEEEKRLSEEFNIKMQAAVKQRESFENQLEYEQEFIVNKLQKQIKQIQEEKQNLQEKVESTPRQSDRVSDDERCPIYRRPRDLKKIEKLKYAMMCEQQNESLLNCMQQLSQTTESSELRKINDSMDRLDALENTIIEWLYSHISQKNKESENISQKNKESENDNIILNEESENKTTLNNDEKDNSTLNIFDIKNNKYNKKTFFENGKIEYCPAPASELAQTILDKMNTMRQTLQSEKNEVLLVVPSLSAKQVFSPKLSPQNVSDSKSKLLSKQILSPRHDNIYKCTYSPKITPQQEYRCTYLSSKSSDTCSTISSGSSTPNLRRFDIIYNVKEGLETTQEECV